MIKSCCKFIALLFFLIVLDLINVKFSHGDIPTKNNEKETIENDSKLEDIFNKIKIKNEGTLLSDEYIFKKLIPFGKKMIQIKKIYKKNKALTIGNNLQNISEILHSSSVYNIEASHPLYMDTLRKREKYLLPSHPDLKITLYYKSVLFTAQIIFNEVLPFAEQALQIRESILGAEHPDVAQSLETLSALLASKGDYRSAYPLSMRALQIREKTLGSAHPAVAQSLHQQAIWSMEQGNRAKASSLFKQALQIREDSLGPNHLEVAKSLCDLSKLRALSGDYKDAYRLAIRGLRIRENFFGPNHPEVAMSLDLVARHLYGQGAYIIARPLLKRAIDIWERRLGPLHRLVAGRQDNLARLLYRQGDYVTARALYESLLQNWEQELGSYDPLLYTHLNNLGEVIYAQGDFDVAESLFQRSLTLLEKSGWANTPKVAITLNLLAELHRSRGDYHKALPFYKRAVKILETTQEDRDHPQLASVLNNLAELHRAQGAYDAANRLYQRSLDIRIKVLGPAHPLVSMTYTNIAELRLAQGEYTEACNLQDKALRVSIQNLGSTHPDVIRIRRRQDELRHAYDHYATACHLDSLESPFQEEIYGAEYHKLALKLHDRAESMLSEGDYASARIFAERALKIQKKILAPDDLRIANSLYTLADLLDIQGFSDESNPLFEQVFDIRKKVLGSTHPLVATTLTRMAVLQRYLGDYSKGYSLAKQARQILKTAVGPNHQYVAYNLHTLAALLTDQGNYTAARTLYERALNIWENTLGPDHPEVARALDSLAALLLYQGDYSAAIPLAERAVQLLEQAMGPDHPWLVKSLQTLAWLRYTQGKFTSANRLAERALQIAELVYEPTHLEISQSVNTLATLLVRQSITISRSIRKKHVFTQASIPNSFHNMVRRQLQDRYSKARQLLEQGLKIHKSHFGSDHPLSVNILYSLGQLLEIQGDDIVARQLMMQAIKSLENYLGTDTLVLVPYITSLGWLEWRHSNLLEAREHFFRATHILKVNSKEILSTLTFAEQWAFISKYIPDNISGILSSYRDESEFTDGYDLISYWKGVLTESIYRYNILSNNLYKNPKDKILIDKLKKIQIKLSGLYRKIGIIPSKSWEDLHEKITKQKENLERMLFNSLPVEVKERLFIKNNLITFQKLLRPGEVFVDIYRYANWQHIDEEEDRYAAVVVGSVERPVLVELGKAKVIEDLISSWRNIVLRKREPSDAWQRLASMAWQAIADKLPIGTRQVWLSPDSELSRIPWHLFLLDKNSGTQDIRLTQIDSARTLARLRRISPISTPETSHTFLLVGGIDFDISRIEPGYERLNNVWQPLPGSITAVEKLSALGKKNNVDVIRLIGDKASKNAVIKILPRATYAHLATHGFFAPERRIIDSRPSILSLDALQSPYQIKRVRNPLVESGIALSRANIFNPSNMEALGLLTAEEIAGLDLSRTNLVTLSACESGRGEELTGQGVIGLWSAVIAAGARSVLMSIWKVPDDATAFLMTHFYKNLWTDKLSKTDALKRAQEDLRKEPKFSHPFYWAAWVLAGEGW